MRSPGFICYSLDSSRIFRIPAVAGSPAPARPATSRSTRRGTTGNKQMVSTAARPPFRRCPHDRPPAAEERASCRAGSLRPAERARRLRRRLRRSHQGQEEPRNHRAGPEDPREPRSPRRGRRRSADGRRRGHPDPDSGRVLPRRDGQAGRDAAACRRIWGRDDLPAEGKRVADRVRAGARAHGEGRRSGRARLARRAGRSCDADLARGEGERARDPPDLHRPRQGRDGDGRAGAQALRDPQDGEPPDPGAQAQARQGILRAVDVGAHGRLQGAAARGPGRRVLPRPAGRAHRVGARARAPALLDEHVPRVWSSRTRTG